MQAFSEEQCCSKQWCQSWASNPLLPSRTLVTSSVTSIIPLSISLTPTTRNLFKSFGGNEPAKGKKTTVQVQERDREKECGDRCEETHCIKFHEKYTLSAVAEQGNLSSNFLPNKSSTFCLPGGLKIRRNGPPQKMSPSELGGQYLLLKVCPHGRSENSLCMRKKTRKTSGITQQKAIYVCATLGKAEHMHSETCVTCWKKNNPIILINKKWNKILVLKLWWWSRGPKKQRLSYPSPRVEEPSPDPPWR